MKLVIFISSNMEKEIWKKINGKLVNPNYVIADFYEVSNKGRIRNTKTECV